MDGFGRASVHAEAAIDAAGHVHVEVHDVQPALLAVREFAQVFLGQRLDGLDVNDIHRAGAGALSTTVADLHGIDQRGSRPGRVVQLLVRVLHRDGRHEHMLERDAHAHQGGPHAQVEVAEVAIDLMHMFRIS